MITPAAFFAEGDVVEVTIRKGHHVLSLRKVKPGPLLRAINPKSEVFYELAVDGRLLFFSDSEEGAKLAIRSVAKDIGLAMSEVPQ